MSADLTGWLLEQIAEDEHVARQVSAVELAGAIVPGANGGVGPQWDAKDGAVFAEGITWDGVAEGFQGTLLWDARNRRGTSSFAAVHMARWDPARVLAECDAKRQLIELHTLDEADELPYGHWEGHGSNERWIRDEPNDCPVCDEDEPCPTLRLLALPYSDRDGYREEWRPDVPEAT